MGTVSTTFHRVVIGPARFEASLSADGPYISRVYGRDHHEGVALGYVTSIERHAGDDRKRPGLYVCKYGDQPRIWLDDLDEGQVGRLSVEFALPIDDMTGLGCLEGFWESPAGAGLVDLIRRHPRALRAYAANQSYMPQWYQRATTRAKDPTYGVVA